MTKTSHAAGISARRRAAASGCWSGASIGANTLARWRDESNRNWKWRSGFARMRTIVNERAHSRTWLLLILSVAVCLPPIFVRVGDTEPDRIMENLTILSSQETWMRLADGERDAWLMPSLFGRARIEKPPMSIWLNLLAWSGLDPATAPADLLVLRSRVLSSALAALALVSAFWIGMTLTGDARLASLATLVTGSTTLFVYQARFATYDTHMLGFVSLAAAASVWAMPSPGRRLAGWLLAGVALAAGTLAKGPIACLHVLGPLVLAVFILPGPKGRRVAGLAVVAVVAAALTVPWFAYAARTVAGTADRLVGEYTRIADRPQPPWYYLSLLVRVAPWTLWFAAALALPFLKADRERRREFLFAWAWVMLLVWALSTSHAKKPRYIAPILPAVGLLTAQFWAWHARQSDEGRAPAWLEWFRRLHWAALIAAPLLLAAFVFVQGPLVGAGWLEAEVLPGLAGFPLALVAVALSALAVQGGRWHARGAVWRAAFATALWMLILATPVYWSYSQAVHAKYACRADAERVAELTKGRRLVVLQVGRRTDPDPAKVFLFYLRRIVPVVSLDELKAMRSEGEPVDVIITAGRDLERFIEPLGYTKSLDYE